MDNKSIVLRVNFEKFQQSEKTPLDDTSVFFQKMEDRIIKYYESIGLKNKSINYSISEKNINPSDYIWMTADYIARVCWAFNKQRNQDYLHTIYRAFILPKIEIKNIQGAAHAIIEFEDRNRLQAGGLVDFFGLREAHLKESGETLRKDDQNIMEFWCDGLNVNRVENLKEKISILYEIKDENNNIRPLLNPIKTGLFQGVRLIEHLESLNLLVGITFTKIKSDLVLENKLKNIIFQSFETYFLKPQLLDDPATAMVIAKEIVESKNILN